VTDAKEREDGDSTVGYRELVRFIARASLASFSFGPRLWWRRARVLSRYGVELVHALRVLGSGPGHGGEAQGILLDAVRAYFRTMAELPERESLRLQRALDRIAASMVGADGSTRPERYVRRWSEKP
jgi:hypothetical protein